MSFKTDQEAFWAGSFGDQYIERNQSERLLTSKIVMFSKMLEAAHGVASVRELGCNIGLNLLALHRLNPDLQLEGVEINAKAAEAAIRLNVADITHGSALEPIEADPVDLTFTAGVLIHIDPEHLGSIYQNLVTGSSRYVLVAEYFNPSPVEIPYRGHARRLFKRDFAGDLMDQFGLNLVDYGFIYKRDKWAPQDNLNWFLLEKGSSR